MGQYRIRMNDYGTWDLERRSWRGWVLMCRHVTKSDAEAALLHFLENQQVYHYDAGGAPVAP